MRRFRVPETKRLASGETLLSARSLRARLTLPRRVGLAVEPLGAALIPRFGAALPGRFGVALVARLGAALSARFGANGVTVAGAFGNDLAAGFAGPGRFKLLLECAE